MDQTKVNVILNIQFNFLVVNIEQNINFGFFSYFSRIFFEALRHSSPSSRIQFGRFHDLRKPRNIGIGFGIGIGDVSSKWPTKWSTATSKMSGKQKQSAWIVFPLKIIHFFIRQFVTFSRCIFCISYFYLFTKDSQVCWNNITKNVLIKILIWNHLWLKEN